MKVGFIVIIWIYFFLIYLKEICRMYELKFYYDSFSRIKKYSIVEIVEERD